MCRPASHQRGSDSGPAGAKPGYRRTRPPPVTKRVSPSARHLAWLTWAKQFGADRDPDATPLRPRA